MIYDMPSSANNHNNWGRYMHGCYIAQLYCVSGTCNSNVVEKVAIATKSRMCSQTQNK